MKKHLIYLLLLLSVSAQAQSYYDYMDDYNAGGGVDGALNFIIILFLLVIVVLVFSLISFIIYWLSPEDEIDRRKREKAEQERKEKNRIEQERERAYLALPENIVHLVIEGIPQFVGLSARYSTSEMITTCLYTINKITEKGTDITNKVDYFNKYIYIYGKYYKSKFKSPTGLIESLGNLIFHKYFIELAHKSSIETFEVKFTIRGDFEPEKLQFIQKHNVSSTNKHYVYLLEFVLYDGVVIQTHLANGNPITFPRPEEYPLSLLLFNIKPDYN